MMKTLKYFAFSFLLLATACFNERDHSIKSVWVSFDEEVIEVLEDIGSPVEAVVAYSGPLRDQDITITYTITQTGAVEGSDFTFPAQVGTVVIPAGQATVDFTALQSIIDNDQKDGERLITFTIDQADGLPVGFPGPDQRKKSMTISIVDNDCEDNIPKIAKWLGPVQAEDVGFDTYPATASAAAGGICGSVLLVEGDILGFSQNSVITIVFEQDAPGSSTGTVIVERNRFFTNDSLSGYEYEGTGTYDEETGEIIIDYNFYRPDGSLWFPGTHLITR